MVRAERVRNGLQQRVGQLAPVLVYEQSLEMEALSSGVYWVLTHKVKTQTACILPAEKPSTKDPMKLN